VSRTALQHTSTTKKVKGIFALGDSELMRPMRNLQSKKIMQRTQVLNGKLLEKTTNKTVNDLGVEELITAISST
jgi:hypothetical protein